MSDATDFGIIGRVPFVDGVTRDVYEDQDRRRRAPETLLLTS